MNQCRGLKCVVGALASHAAGSEPAEFLVDERYQTIERLLITACPLQQKTRHITRGICQVRGPLKVYEIKVGFGFGGLILGG